MQTAKLKIIYLLTTGGIGGAQRYVQDLTASLPRDRFETKVLRGGSELRWLSNHISPLFLMNDWFAVIELVRVFRRETPNIIHLNSSKAGVLGSFAAFIYNSALRPSGTRKAKVVFTAHGWVFNPANHPTRLVRTCYALLHWAAAFFEDAIINVSKTDYKIALKYRIAPLNKLFTVPNGINPDMPFSSKEDARKEIRRRLTTYDLRLTTDAPWIGSIGRLTKEKDYVTLIRAATLVPNACFFFIGDGPELDNLKLLVKNLSSRSGTPPALSKNSNETARQLMIENLKLTDRIFFVPPKGKDALLMKAFDLFVLSSVKEGLPYSLLEAMAAALPIVATDAGGVLEVLGRFSWCVVAKRNPEAIAAKIKEFFENPLLLDATREAISQSVSNRYRLDRMVEETEKIYQNLAT